MNYLGFIRRVSRRLYFPVALLGFVIERKVNSVNKSFYLSEYLDSINKSSNDRRVWLIGNGPSVLLSDLENIPDRDIKVVANRFHLAYPKTKFRPDIVVSNDEQVIRDFGEEICEKNRGLFIAFAVRQWKNISANLYFRRFIPIRFVKGERFVYANGGGSLFLGFQLAYSLGYRNFVIYGVDHDFKFELDEKGMASGEGNHFLQNYRENKNWVPPKTLQIEKSFKLINDTLKSNGGSILNVSRKSNLPYIKQQDIGKIL